jgi:hypothetical protein
MVRPWKLWCYVEQVDGKTFQVVLQGVKYLPKLWVNLFSISKALKRGFMIGNDGIIMHLTKGNTILSFNNILNLEIWSYPLGSVIFVYVHGYLLGILGIVIEITSYFSNYNWSVKRNVCTFLMVQMQINEDCLAIEEKFICAVVCAFA